MQTGRLGHGRRYSCPSSLKHLQIFAIVVVISDESDIPVVLITSINCIGIDDSEGATLCCWSSEEHAEPGLWGHGHVLIVFACMVV